MSGATVAKSANRNPLLSLETPQPVAAKANLKKTETLKATGALLREAIRRANLTASQASALCGVKDEAQFCRMLDGLESFGVHRLLTDEAQPIWNELVAIRAARSGYAVERVIHIPTTEA